jgi:hypothetical protein
MRLNYVLHFFVSPFFRGMCSGADLNILKDSDIHPPHIQLQVPESILYPKAALPRILEFCLNHALCLKHRWS